MKLYRYSIIAVVLLAVLLAGLAGCDQIGGLSDLTDKAGELLDQATGALGGTGEDEPHGQPDPRGQTITDYFSGQEVFFYRHITGEKITPVSGTPPSSTGTREYLANEELFFNSGSSIDGSSLTVNISRVNNTEFFAGTTTKSWFDWPQSLTITEQSSTMLVAKGEGHGRTEKTSDAENYVYNFTTYETWIFATDRLENLTTVTVTTDAPSLPISAPGWVGTGRDYSQYGITVTAHNPYGFRLQPAIKLIRVNGYDEITQGLEWTDTELSPTSRRFTFGSFYNADYVVVGGCRTLGKNSGILGETWDDTGFTIRVTSAEKPLPDYYYPEE